MKTTVFSTKPYDRGFLEAGNTTSGHQLVFVENRLRADTLMLAAGCPAICAFVNDVLDGAVLRGFHLGGTRFIALRCAGYNNVDLPVARELGFKIARVPAYAPYAVADLPLDEVLAQSNFLSLHCPLLPATRHLLDAASFARLPIGALVINTSRGALTDAESAVKAIKSGHLGGLALDVYEEEAGWFFDDHSSDIIQDDTFMRLLSFPNVLVTSHQAFFTREAMENIAATTLGNLTDFEAGRENRNGVV